MPVAMIGITLPALTFALSLNNVMNDSIFIAVHEIRKAGKIAPAIREAVSVV